MEVMVEVIVEVMVKVIGRDNGGGLWPPSMCQEAPYENDASIS